MNHRGREKATSGLLIGVGGAEFKSLTSCSVEDSLESQEVVLAAGEVVVLSNDARASWNSCTLRKELLSDCYCERDGMYFSCRKTIGSVLPAHTGFIKRSLRMTIIGTM